MSAEDEDRSPQDAGEEAKEPSSDNSHYFALAKGTRLFEFEILEVLGHGGFGITYLALDTHLQEQVAIKEYLPNDLAVRVSSATVRPKSASSNADFEAGLKTFLEEARLVARIKHNNVIRVRRFFEHQGTGYIVQDYEEGSTLGQRLSKGPIPEPELRTILSKILDGLEYVHDRAILHRDIKPSNIMLRGDGAPVLIDFGAARDFASRHSRSVTAIATPGYTPPEQFGVGGEQGPWTDIYALGAVMYRCVTGKAPVDSLRRLRKDSLVPASTAAEGAYDPSLLGLIDWMLKIEESERPASIKAVREALGTAGKSGVQPQSSSQIKRIGKDRAVIELPKSVDADVLELSFFVTPPGKYLGFSVKDNASWRAKPHYFGIHSTKGNPEFSTFEIGEKIVNALPENSHVTIASADDFIKASAKWVAPEEEKKEAPKVNPVLWRNVAIGSGVALLLLLGAFGLFKRDESAYLAAQHSEESVAAYLKNCSMFCFSRDKAEARIRELKQQQQLQTLERQLSGAGTRIPDLEKFLKDCGPDCSPVLRERATTLLNQQKNAASEDSTYRAARGNIARLNDYISSCKLCTYRDIAREEVSRLQAEADRQAMRERERNNYYGAGNNLSSLNQYVNSCSLCEFKAEAQAKISKLEYEDKFFWFTVCNRANFKVSVAIAGRKDPNSDRFMVIGWYQPDPGQCMNVGRWVKGRLYYMAKQYGGNIGWRGNAIRFCVSNAAFERANTTGYTCRQDERLEGFFERSQFEDFTWTLTLN